MKWTKDKPTKPGIYWVRDSVWCKRGTSRPFLIQVYLSVESHIYGRLIPGNELCWSYMDNSSYGSVDKGCSMWDEWSDEPLSEPTEE